MRRITAVIVAVAAAFAIGCEGSGGGNGLTGPFGCETLQGSQNVNNWSNCLSYTNGGGGGGGGGGLTPGEAPAALYRLVSVNGAALPFTFGTYDSVVTTDSIRVIDFVLDSSIISLNSDSTVTRIDYIKFRDFRSSITTHPPQNFNVDTITADTSTGTWSDSTGQPTIELLSGLFASNIGYQYHGDTLSANYAYNVVDPAPITTGATSVPGVATFYYQNVGSPQHDVVGNRRNSRSSASPSSPVRQSRVGGPSLSFVGSNDGSSRFVRVIGQQH